MRFEELLDRWEKGSLSHAEAASALGVSERTLRRWRERYQEEGADGLGDRRVGQPSPRRAPKDELERMRALYQETYQGFTIKHFHEKRAQRHNYKLGYTTTRLYLHKTGTVPPAPRRGAHRRKRPRRPMVPDPRGAGPITIRKAPSPARFPQRPPSNAPSRRRTLIRTKSSHKGGSSGYPRDPGCTVDHATASYKRRCDATPSRR